MKFFLVFLITWTFSICSAQKSGLQSFSIAVLTTNNSYPFHKLSSLISGNYHPGFSAGVDYNWKTAQHHDWFQRTDFTYFFHRYVQHAIALNTAIGYRYKWNRLGIESTFGGGYLHSIPATTVLKINNKGEYVNHKGAGRPQGNIVFGIGTYYQLRKQKRMPENVFLTWQQRLQFPFVHAYVPVLPYTSLSLGISIFLKKHSSI
jgi:hypothetical protein